MSSSMDCCDACQNDIEEFEGRLIDLEKKLDDLGERLRKARLKVLRMTQAAVRAARKKARLDIAGTADGKVKGRHPDIWKRKPVRDPDRVEGEAPSWAQGLSSYMEAENENEDADAQERMENAAEEDAGDPRAVPAH